MYRKKPNLTWIDKNTVGLVPYSNVPMWLRIGGKEVQVASTLRANILASGVGGLSAGTVAAGTVYYVYAITVANQPNL